MLEFNFISFLVVLGTVPVEWIYCKRTLPRLSARGGKYWVVNPWQTNDIGMAKSSLFILLLLAKAWWYSLHIETSCIICIISITITFTMVVKLWPGFYHLKASVRYLEPMWQPKFTQDPYLKQSKCYPKARVRRYLEPGRGPDLYLPTSQDPKRPNLHIYSNPNESKCEEIPGAGAAPSD